jgi:hypothetical protein
VSKAAGLSSDREVSMKNCKLCRFSKVCNDLPGICIVLQYAAVLVLVGSLGFLFLTQEVLA